MIVSSHQPSFFPWAGYWHRLAASDYHIVSAGVRFDYGGYQNRVPFGGSWLTLPIVGEAKTQAIKDVRFDPKALPRVFRSIEQGPGAKRHPHRDRVLRVIEGLRAGQFLIEDRLLDFNLRCLDLVRQELGLSCKIRVSTDAPRPDTCKTQRLVERVCAQVGHDPLVYLAGRGTAAYLDYTRLPRTFTVWVQEPKDGVQAGSVLEILAAESEPLEAIRRMFGWRIWHEEEDSRALSTLG